MKQKLITKDRGLIYRYPRVFVGVTTTAALLVFFSRPIYDVFFSTEVVSLEDLKKNHKSQFTRK